MWPVPFGGGWQCGNAVLDATCVTRHDHQGGTLLHQPNPWEERVELSKARFQFSASFSEKPGFCQQNRVFDQAASPTHKKASKNHNLLFCGLVAHPPATWVTPTPSTPQHPPTTSTGSEGYTDVCIYTYIYMLYVFAHRHTTYVYTHDHNLLMHTGPSPSRGEGEHQTLGHTYIYIWRYDMP